MNSTQLLRRAAASVSGPGSYSRHAPASEPVYLATMRPYSATETLERASCRLRSGAAYCVRGCAQTLAEAKARVCRAVGFPHIDAWEHTARPTWEDVRRVFQEAAA